MTADAESIELEDLHTIKVLPDGGHFHILHKCILCLEDQKHTSPVKMAKHDLQGAAPRSDEIEIRWVTQSTPQMRKAYADMSESAEDSAKGLAFLLAKQLGYDICEQVPRGPHIDYYMCCISEDAKQDDMLIFNNKIGLEISGILNGPKKINARVKEKKIRIENGGGFSPSMIVVIEHSTPQAMIDMV